MANGEIDPREEIRRRLERLLGYPSGALDPYSNVLRDMERINRALGEGFTLLQNVFGPQELLDRIEAFHPDGAILRLQKAAQDVLRLPREMWKLPPEETDKYKRGV